VDAKVFELRCYRLPSLTENRLNIGYVVQDQGPDAGEVIDDSGTSGLGKVIGLPSLQVNAYVEGEITRIRQPGSKNETGMNATVANVDDLSEERRFFYGNGMPPMTHVHNVERGSFPRYLLSLFNGYDLRFQVFGPFRRVEGGAPAKYI